jgi:RimJ/RimL family protein N-acetyltransferase
LRKIFFSDKVFFIATGSLVNLMKAAMMSLENKVSIRSLNDADRTQLALLANNKKIWDNLRNHMPHPYSSEDAQDFIETTKKEKPQENFAIDYEGKFCGIIGILLQADVYAGTAEIGYWIGEPFWNLGIATEAVRQVTNYGFEQLGLRRIYASVFAFNAASMQVLEKNGYSKEGVGRSAIMKNGVIADDHRYSILK